MTSKAERAREAIEKAVEDDCYKFYIGTPAGEMKIRTGSRLTQKWDTEVVSCEDGFIELETVYREKHFFIWEKVVRTVNYEIELEAVEYVQRVYDV